MAVRHEVENLIRRGNIFYWRPRVPAALINCGPGSRLSLSLHCSDHRKAQIIGRKLNTRLAALKLNSKEMMSKQQLQKLFEHLLILVDRPPDQPEQRNSRDVISVRPLRPSVGIAK
jgi:hypothetical protein